MDKVTLDEKFASFRDPWVPHVVAELNGQMVKVAKFEGAFEWHSHAEEDELFWVHKGRIEIHLRDRVVPLGPGELFVVPRGVEHRPVADGLAEVVMFEPAATRNTGDQQSARTIDGDALKRI